MTSRLLAAAALAAAALLPVAPAGAAASPYAVCTSLAPCLVSCASNSIVTVNAFGDGYGTATCAGTSATCRAYPTTPCNRTAVVVGGAGAMYCNADAVGRTPTFAICTASPFIN